MNMLDIILKEELDYEEAIIYCQFLEQNGCKMYHFDYKGISCIIDKYPVNPRFDKHSITHLCGYIDAELEADIIRHVSAIEEKIHYGFTFLGKLEGRLYIGFDCNHSGDIGSDNPSEGATYKTAIYVQNCIKAAIDEYEHIRKSEIGIQDE